MDPMQHGGYRPMVSKAVERLGLVAAVLGTLAACAPVAQAVQFSVPTSFEVGSLPKSIAAGEFNDALITLRALFTPTPVYLVHLEISNRMRDQRLAREGISGERGAAWEEHSTEQDIGEALPRRADLVVAVNEQPEQAAGKIIDWLKGPRNTRST